MTLFSLGLAGTAILVLRLVKHFRIRRTPPDLVPVWVGALMDAITWSMIEVGVLILCANLPGLYALLTRRSPNVSSKPLAYSWSSRGAPHDYGLRNRDTKSGPVSSSAFGNSRLGSSGGESRDRIVAQPDAIFVSTRVSVEAA